MQLEAEPSLSERFSERLCLHITFKISRTRVFVHDTGLKRRYRDRTPAMAAGFTDHIWTVGELVSLPLVFEGGAC
jgi:hypothetical protein